SRNASCIGCSLPPDSARPSIVVILAPSHWSASVVQDLAAIPSTCTTQAPHWDVSQPTCVPVSLRFSRRNCTSKVRASTSPETGFPFTVMDTVGIAFLPFRSESPLIGLSPFFGGGRGVKSRRFRSSLALEQVASVDPRRRCGQAVQTPRGAEPAVQSQDFSTVAAKLRKKSSASFLAAPL